MENSINFFFGNRPLTVFSGWPLYFQDYLGGGGGIDLEFFGTGDQYLVWEGVKNILRKYIGILPIIGGTPQTIYFRFSPEE